GGAVGGDDGVDPRLSGAGQDEQKKEEEKTMHGPLRGVSGKQNRRARDNRVRRQPSALPEPPTAVLVEESTGLVSDSAAGAALPLRGQCPDCTDFPFIPARAGHRGALII